MVIAGHSRPKDGVLSPAYDPAIHEVLRQRKAAGVLRFIMDARVKPAHDVVARRCLSTVGPGVMPAMAPDAARSLDRHCRA
jgi:hypothetical protein